MNETNTLYVRCLSDPRWASEEIHRLRQTMEGVRLVLSEAKQELIWAEGHWGADYHEITEKIDALLKRFAPA